MALQEFSSMDTVRYIQRAMKWWLYRNSAQWTLLDTYTWDDLFCLFTEAGVPGSWLDASRTVPPTMCGTPFPGWLNAWAVRLLLLGTHPAAFVLQFSFCSTCNGISNTCTTTNTSFLFINSSTSSFIYQWSVNCTGYINSLSSLVGHHTHTLLIYCVSTEAVPINATHFCDNTDTWLALVTSFVPTTQLKLTISVT